MCNEHLCDTMEFTAFTQGDISSEELSNLNISFENNNQNTAFC